MISDLLGCTTIMKCDCVYATLKVILVEIRPPPGYTGLQIELLTDYREDYMEILSCLLQQSASFVCHKASYQLSGPLMLIMIFFVERRKTLQSCILGANLFYGRILQPDCVTQQHL